MSATSRGRGRGRGAGRSSLSRQLSSDEDIPVPNAGQVEDANENGDDNDGDATMRAPPSRSPSQMPASPAVGAGQRPSLQGRQSSIAATGSAGTLLRRNVYTATADNKMKFKPQMVRRKVQTEDAVKEEEVEPSLMDPTASRGRGRGRGRGARGDSNMTARGRGEIVMTASGAFAQGPSASERGPVTNGRSFGASVMMDWSPSTGGGGGSGTGAGSRKVTSTATLVDSDPEDYNGDDAHDRHGKKVETVDLYDIGKEGEMAPLVLPRDEKKWLEEEELRTENERAMRRLRGIKEDKKGSNEDANLDPALAKTKLKMDPYEEEEMLAASLRGTPASTIGGTDSSRAQSISSSSAKPEEDVHMAAVAAEEAGRAEAPPAEDAAVLGADDVKIKVKKENVAPYFDLPKEEVSSERFYVFQFPRLFPQFFDPATGPPSAPQAVKAEGEEDMKPAPGALNAVLNGMQQIGAGGGSSVPDEYSSAKHKVRSAYHESESEAWRDYEAGKWQGWGRNPGRDDRESMAGDGTEELTGRIGKIKIRKSGKTTMKLGGIEYEILPGAPASFLQEIAVLNPDAEDKPGMYVMGQMSKKFVIAPELTKLLTQDAMERREALVRKKQEEEEKLLQAQKAKLEEAEVKIPPPLKKKTGTAAGTAKKAAPAKPRPKPAASAKPAAGSAASKAAPSK